MERRANDALCREPGFHLIASLTHVEAAAMDRSEIMLIADTVTRRLGLYANQWIAAMHVDAIHIHIHVVGSVVRPDGTVVQLANDRRTLRTVSRSIENRLGVAQTPAFGAAISGRASDAESWSRLPSFSRWVGLGARAVQIETSANWNDYIARWATLGVRYLPMQNGGVLVTSHRGRTIRAGAHRSGFIPPNEWGLFPSLAVTLGPPAYSHAVRLAEARLIATEPLYVEYLREVELWNIRGRESVRQTNDALRAERGGFEREVKAALASVPRGDARSAFRAAVQEARVSMRARHSATRAEAIETRPSTRFGEWLKTRAARGADDAAAALERTRAQRARASAGRTARVTEGNTMAVDVQTRAGGRRSGPIPVEQLPESLRGARQALLEALDEKPTWRSVYDVLHPRGYTYGEFFGSIDHGDGTSSDYRGGGVYTRAGDQYVVRPSDLANGLGIKALESRLGPIVSASHPDADLTLHERLDDLHRGGLDADERARFQKAYDERARRGSTNTRGQTVGNEKGANTVETVEQTAALPEDVRFKKPVGARFGMLMSPLYEAFRDPNTGRVAVVMDRAFVDESGKVATSGVSTTVYPAGTRDQDIKSSDPRGRKPTEMSWDDGRWEATATRVVEIPKIVQERNARETLVNFAGADTDVAQREMVDAAREQHVEQRALGQEITLTRGEALGLIDEHRASVAAKVSIQESLDPDTPPIVHGAEFKPLLDDLDRVRTHIENSTENSMYRFRLPAGVVMEDLEGQAQRATYYDALQQSIDEEQERASIDMDDSREDDLVESLDRVDDDREGGVGAARADERVRARSDDFEIGTLTAPGQPAAGRIEGAANGAQRPANDATWAGRLAHADRDFRDEMKRADAGQASDSREAAFSKAESVIRHVRQRARINLEMAPRAAFRDEMATAPDANYRNDGTRFDYHRLQEAMAGLEYSKEADKEYGKVVFSGKSRIPAFYHDGASFRFSPQTSSNPAAFQQNLRIALIAADAQWGGIQIDGNEPFKKAALAEAARLGIKVQNPELQEQYEKLREGFQKESQRRADGFGRRLAAAPEAERPWVRVVGGSGFERMSAKDMEQAPDRVGNDVRVIAIEQGPNGGHEMLVRTGSGRHQVVETTPELLAMNGGALEEARRQQSSKGAHIVSGGGKPSEAAHSAAIKAEHDGISADRQKNAMPLAAKDKEYAKKLETKDHGLTRSIIEQLARKTPVGAGIVQHVNQRQAEERDRVKAATAGPRGRSKGDDEGRTRSGRGG